METISITVYTADELQNEYPEAFERAREKFVRDYWDTFGIEHVNDTLALAEMDERSPFADRFIEWDLYGGWAHYAAGSLSWDEANRVGEWDATLDYSTLELDDVGYLTGYADEEANEEEFAEALESVNKKLRDLYAEFALRMRTEVEWLEGDKFFIDMAEANEWQFEADGSMR
jgi:hypothetical protein